MTQCREVRLKSRPNGMPTHDNFEICEVEVADPGPGQVLVRNHYMSVDPYMRGRMYDRKSYVPPFQVGAALDGGAVGEVIASNSDALPVGAFVQNGFGWREAFVAEPRQLQPVDPEVAPLSAYLGVLGMPGMTAYVGLFRAASLKDGETVFVSGAAGAVGSLAGQIAKIKGCRVLGSAGSDEKVRHLTDDLGFDYAFNYREGDLLARLREGAPDGLDVYFDNIGADHLEAALFHMRQFGRIALCGAIAVYNDATPRPGPSNLTMAIGMGLRLQGFIVNHYNDSRDDFIRDVSGWIAEGKVKYDETILDGIDQAPAAFEGLFTGRNVGKMLVKLI
ncbi:MAG: NADP-dependent oxidoreductase [Gammaproteobacteria bacterium]|nr:MAG: NADP-dependent oxidoreductase [Gammaproteobacteria bacterium]